MTVKYNKLWKKLIDLEMSRTEMRLKKTRSLMSASVNAYRLRYIASFGAYAPPNSKLCLRAVGEPWFESLQNKKK